MKYKKYFRKTSLKQKGDGDFFLNEIKLKSPKIFLEVGVFHGVTARNVCELLYKIHGNNFKYIGLDLFEKSDENKSEIIPNTNFSNPLKQIYFKYLKKQEPYSLNAVKELLKKFENNVELIVGNSNIILKKLDMSKIDFVFLDGGHDYKTVKSDLNNSIEVVNFFTKQPSKILFSIFIVVSYFFSALNISEIFEDYIKNEKIKNVAKQMLNIFAIIISLLTIIGIFNLS